MDYELIGRTEAPITWLYECQSCGVPVSDRNKHDTFHEGLARTARQADSADMWTRPIGGGDSIPPAHRAAYQEMTRDPGTHFGDPIG